jgi:hypothetical protein
MLDKLTHFDFAALVTQRFRLDEGVVSFELELVGAEAASSSSARDAARAPFSLTCRGPRHPLLRPRLYPLHHPSLGKLELFLVPIGPDASGQRYQAIVPRSRA